MKRIIGCGGNDPQTRTKLAYSGIMGLVEIHEVITHMMANSFKLSASAAHSMMLRCQADNVCPSLKEPPSYATNGKRGPSKQPQSMNYMIALAVRYCWKLVDAARQSTALGDAVLLDCGQYTDAVFRSSQHTGVLDPSKVWNPTHPITVARKAALQQQGYHLPSQCVDRKGKMCMSKACEEVHASYRVVLRRAAVELPEACLVVQPDHWKRKSGFGCELMADKLGCLLKKTLVGETTFRVCLDVDCLPLRRVNDYKVFILTWYMGIAPDGQYKYTLDKWCFWKWLVMLLVQLAHGVRIQI